MWMTSKLARLPSGLLPQTQTLPSEATVTDDNVPAAMLDIFIDVRMRIG
jgi:hypothetical protein